MTSISVDSNRRRLLLGRSQQLTKVHKLPWLVNVNSFVNDCTRCNKCVEVCPENIIVKGDGGFPEINFSQGDCQFCYQCADICADVPFYPRSKTPWSLKAEISSNKSHQENSCLVTRSVLCQTCKDFCEFDAINLVAAVGRIPEPIINTDLCSGCGACVSACPTQAIFMVNTEMKS